MVDLKVESRMAATEIFHEPDLSSDLRPGLPEAAGLDILIITCRRPDSENTCTDVLLHPSLAGHVLAHDHESCKRARKFAALHLTTHGPDQDPGQEASKIT